MADARLAELKRRVMEGDAEGAAGALHALREAGVGDSELINGALVPAMEEIGRLWNQGEVFIPEVIQAAAAFQKCLDALGSTAGASGVRVVLGTVKGDLHDLGKNLVGILMRTAGFEVIDLGKDVPAERFVQAVKETGAAVLGLSALLTTTMMEQQRVIEALKAAGLRDKVKVMVGGAPVTQEWADRIGADGYAPNAHEAVRKAQAILGIEVGRA